MPPDVAIYTRISKDRAGAGLGIDRQLRECHELARRHGWSVSATFSDNDVSAYSGKRRPGYEALLEAIRAGQVRHVVAWHTDRLHRSTRDLLDYVDIVRTAGVLTHTVQTGPIDLSTATGIATAITLGAWAEHESAIKSERLRAKSSEIAAAGGYSGGVRPFGFEADGITVRPSEADEVARVTEQVLAGCSLREIARGLNERGVTSSLGNLWTPNQVKSMVTKPRNAGLRQHRGEVVGPAAWPALVDEGDWRSATAILSDPSRRTTSTNARRYLLSGIAKCGECGGVVIAKWTRSGKGRRLIYHCRYKHCTSRALHHVDELITETILARLAREDARDLVVAADPHADRDARLESDRLNARLVDAAQAFASGSITLSQLTTITDACRGRLAQLEAVETQTSARPVLVPLVSASDLRATWDALSLANKRAVIDLLLTVQLHKTRQRGPGFDMESVGLTWRC